MRAILTYHSLDDSGSPISLAPGVFESQVRWLALHGPEVVPLAALAGLPADRDAVSLTFDDAFENFAAVAAPVLRAEGLPATLFVVSGRVGETNAWGGTRTPGIPIHPLMDWEALGRVAEAGVEIGAHTRTHVHLPRISPERRADEIEGCAAEIEARTGLRPRSFAYPYGSVDSASVEAVSRCFDRAVTTDLRWLAEAEDPHRLPRLDMYYLREPGRLEAWGSGRFRWRLRARRGLRSLRAAVSPPG